MYDEEESVVIALERRVSEAQGDKVAPGDCAKVSPGTRLKHILHDDQPVDNRSTLSLEQLPG